MLQHRPLRPASRSRTLAVGGALAAFAVVGGGTVTVVSAPTNVAAGDIQLVQNAAAQEMELGVPVDLDLEPVVARAAGGTIPEGTSVQVTGLPDGLVQDDWVISGTPTRAGTYDVLVTVSNAGVSKSEKVSITVVDESGAATTADGDGSGASPATGGEAGAAPTTADREGKEPEGTTTSPTTTSQPEPTLSALPGTPTARGGTGTEDDGAGAGSGADADADADTGDGALADLCSIDGDGDVDGASLAAGLAPMLAGGGEATGGEGEAAQAGLAMVLVNAVAGLLPSLLGDSGSTSDAGSAGQILCSLDPSLLGGGTGTGASPDAGAETTAGAGADDTAGAGAGPDGPTAAVAGLANGPAAALLSLLGTGAGPLAG